MISQDYTKEMGLKPVAKKVPMPLAIAILVAILAGVGWFVAQAASFHGASSSQESPAATAQAPAK